MRVSIRTRLLITSRSYTPLSDRNLRVRALTVHRARLAGTEACVPRGAGGRLGCGTRVWKPPAAPPAPATAPGPPPPGRLPPGASSRLRGNLALSRACPRSLPPSREARKLAGGRPANTRSQSDSFRSSEEPHWPLAEGREGPGWACGTDSCCCPSPKPNEPNERGTRRRARVCGDVGARAPRVGARESQRRCWRPADSQGK